MGAQEPTPPELYVHRVRIPAVELRWVDFRWRPEFFAALEKGGNMPDAKRNWILARLINEERLNLEGTSLRASNWGLILWPRDKDRPLTLELREIDMREVLIPNVVGEAPAGVTKYRAPANFTAVPENAERLAGNLTEADGKITMTIQYGNQKLTRTFTRSKNGE
jgi:hypothetical protein